MLDLNPPSLVERLPIELLERILLFTSVRDILRLSLVNHACRSIVLASPSIQYEIDLFSAGLQRNPRTETPLADCRAALAAYRKRWETLDPAEEWDEVFHVSDIRKAVAVNGTYGLLRRNSINFITFGSVSRGIPRKEWDIPLKHLEASIFTFYPQANVVVIVEEVAWTWIIHLNTLDDGRPHPAARTAAFSYTFAPGGGDPVDVLDISITGRRLAVLRGVSDIHIAQVAVWDWITGQLLLELENEFYRCAKFVDDYWLTLALASYEPAVSPRLVLLNTKQTPISDPRLVQTTFHFDPHMHQDVGSIHLHLDQGGHKPSSEESLFAPFYPDASQRVLAIGLNESGDMSVIKTEVLLRLAQERRSTELKWRQWNAHTVKILSGNSIIFWVSGPRLFSMARALMSVGTRVDVYDFGARTSTEYGVEPNTDGYGGFQRVAWPGIRTHRSIDISTVRFPNGGHDSIALLIRQDLEDDENPLACTMRVWEF